MCSNLELFKRFVIALGYDYSGYLEIGSKKSLYTHERILTALKALFLF